MAEARMGLAYDGEALEQGRMSVGELAPALLSLAALCREGNAALDPDAPPVTLHIVATDRGSFDVSLVLVQDGLKHVVDFFTTDTADALLNLKEYLFLSGVGLFWLIRKAKGQTPTATELIADDRVRVTFPDGVVVEVPQSVLDLYSRPHIRRHSLGVVQPLRLPGVETVELRIDDTRVPLSVTSADVASFEVAAAPEALLDNESTFHVTISSVSFTEGNKWRLNDGASTFYAAIEDPAFLDRINRGEEVFRKNDLLRCRVRVQQFRGIDGMLTTERTVLQVLDHQPARIVTAMTLDDI